MGFATKGWKLRITSAQILPSMSPQERCQVTRNMVAISLAGLMKEGGYLGLA